MKPVIVVFTKNNTRLLKSYNLPAVINRRDLVFVNPDLSAVSGVPPHFWKIKEGQIVEMTLPEKEKRLSLIERHEADNDIETPIHGHGSPSPLGVYYVGISFTILAILMALLHYGKH